MLVVDQREITLLLHTIVDYASESFLLVLFNLVNSVPDFLFNLLPCQLVGSDHAFNFL
jgi:hypothetical protein